MSRAIHFASSDTGGRTCGTRVGCYVRGHAIFGSVDVAPDFGYDLVVFHVQATTQV